MLLIANGWAGGVHVNSNATSVEWSASTQSDSVFVDRRFIAILGCSAS